MISKLFKKCAVAVFLICVLVYGYHHSTWMWKLLRPHISVRQFETLADEYNDFLGMEIDEVLRFTTKNSNYFLFTQESLYMGDSYSNTIDLYPWVELSSPRHELFCIPVQSDFSPEEVIAKGVFVDENGIVIEAPINTPFMW